MFCTKFVCNWPYGSQNIKNKRFGGRTGECVSLHVYQAITLWRYSLYKKWKTDDGKNSLVLSITVELKWGTKGKDGHLKTKQRVDVKNILWPAFKNIDGVYMHVVVEN